MKTIICALCKVDITNSKSYFLSFPIKEHKEECLKLSEIKEVCAECHHHLVYGTEEQKQTYLNRRNLIL